LAEQYTDVQKTNIMGKHALQHITCSLDKCRKHGSRQHSFTANKIDYYQSGSSTNLSSIPTNACSYVKNISMF